MGKIFNYDGNILKNDFLLKDETYLGVKSYDMILLESNNFVIAYSTNSYVKTRQGQKEAGATIYDNDANEISSNLLNVYDDGTYVWSTRLYKYLYIVSLPHNYFMTNWLANYRKFNIFDHNLEEQLSYFNLGGKFIKLSRDNTKYITTFSSSNEAHIYTIN